MSLGMKICNLRKERGLSQEQLADSLNVSRQVISKWETDQALPEVDKLLSLSNLFSVSTDFLLDNEVSFDNESKKESKSLMGKILSDSGRYAVNLYKSKDRKLLFYIFSILCFIAIGVCVIVNYSIARTITWALYPIISVTYGWLIGIPVIFRKYILSICSATVLSIPFLYLLDIITPGKSWFVPLGIPSTVIGIIALWLSYLLFRYLKMNLLYKFAVSPCLLGLGANLLINRYVDSFTGTPESFLNKFINIFSYTVSILVLIVLGYLRDKKKVVE